MYKLTGRPISPKFPHFYLIHFCCFWSNEEILINLWFLIFLFFIPKYVLPKMPKGTQKHQFCLHILHPHFFVLAFSSMSEHQSCNCLHMDASLKNLNGRQTTVCHSTLSIFVCVCVRDHSCVSWKDHPVGFSWQLAYISCSGLPTLTKGLAAQSKPD